jgi:ribosomal protein S18 acetylase RimI-like enzyme
MSASPTAPLPALAYRPGTLDDWTSVAPMVAKTWNDGDYIDETTWRAWASDENSQLIVAELDNQLLGFVRLAELGPAEWWLEGLRVDPQRRGQGIGRALLTHIIGLFQYKAIGLLRFFTASNNTIMPKLAEKCGFMHTLSYAPMQIAAQPADYRRFKVLQPSNLEMAYAYLRRSPMYRVNHFAEHHWTAYYLTKERLGEYLADPTFEVLGWRQLDQLHGLAVLVPDPEGEATDTLQVAYLDAGDDTSLGAMLTSLRGIAAKRGFQKMEWKTPLGIGLNRLFLTIELERSWDVDLWLYELPLRH